MGVWCLFLLNNINNINLIEFNVSPCPSLSHSAGFIYDRNIIYTQSSYLLYTNPVCSPPTFDLQYSWPAVFIHDQWRSHAELNPYKYKISRYQIVINKIKTLRKIRNISDCLTRGVNGGTGGSRFAFSVVPPCVTCELRSCTENCIYCKERDYFLYCIDYTFLFLDLRNRRVDSANWDPSHPNQLRFKGFPHQSQSRTAATDSCFHFIYRYYKNKFLYTSPQVGVLTSYVIYLPTCMYVYICMCMCGGGCSPLASVFEGGVCGVCMRVHPPFDVGIVMPRW